MSETTRALDARAASRPTAWQLGLIVLTLASTWWAGVQGTGTYWILRFARSLPVIGDAPALAWSAWPEVFLPGLGYAAAFVGILFAHEMGHYLSARRFGVRASFPYFIPFLPPLGSLGAVIRMDAEPMPGRAMMRIAAFGPFAGMVVALPVLVAGIALSDIRPIPEDFAGAQMGTCLLFQGIQALVLPPVPAGHDVFLHPLGLAGWAGCLITGLNLLPFGQLDGGHVAYCLFGERFNAHVGKFFAVSAVVLLVVSPSFALFLLLIWKVIGVEHPPMVTDGVVRGADRWVGRIAALLLVVTFTPRPFIVRWTDVFESVSSLFG